jgi:catalase
VSPALSLLRQPADTLRGRKIGVLVTDGTDARFLAALRSAAKAEGAALEIVAPTIGGVRASDDKQIEAQHALAGGPSVLFDVVVLAPSESGVLDLVTQAAAVQWVQDAFAHLKVIGHTEAATPLLDYAHVDPGTDEGVVRLDGRNASIGDFMTVAKGQRVWAREPRVRPGT